MKPDKEVNIALWRIEKQKEIKKELQEKPELKKFLANAYPNTFDRFIDEYAAKKVSWLEYGPRYLQWMQQEDLQWIENATTRLAEIQQKKLFDAQCLWRAEKLHIPQIKLTWDFNYWEDNIFRCPFIEPVTEADVDMYIQYLQSSNFENEQGFLDRWQDYAGIKAAEQTGNSNRNFPDWYDFHNGRTGLGIYLQLPDVRGEKENFYLNIWSEETKVKSKELQKKWDEERKQQIENPDMPVTPETDRKPFLNYTAKGWLTWFVNTYEDKQTQEMFKRYGGERPFDGDNDDVEVELEMLNKAEKLIPVQGWYDWKEAIRKAADLYRKEKIIEALPEAFEQYRLKIDMGIAFEEKKSVFDDIKWYPEAILRGRELNGEPRDFNF